MALRPSSTLLGVLNFLALLLSIPILSTGIYLSLRATTDCDHFLQTPLLVLGSALLLASLAGLVGSCCRVNFLLWLYLFALFVLILALLAFTVFAFAVTNQGAGRAVSGKGFKEYRLGDFSHWLQNRVNDTGNWVKIKSCLKDAKVCESLEKTGANQTMEQFINDNLSPTQSGCCKPPTECGFVYRSATVWDKQAGLSSNNTDCNIWQNDPNIRCYDCQSCKAGVLANLKNDWKKIAIINIISLALLIVVYSMGCCAFRNNLQGNRYYPRWK